MKTVAFVPIKLHSQRLPHKNILPLGEMPICWYVPHTLLEIGSIDETYIFCSDPTIQRYVPSGAKFLQRPQSLDGNLVKGAEIYKAFIDMVDADVYILAHTTSPFLKKETISNALSNVLSGEYDSAFSAERIQTFAWCKGQPVNYSLEDVPRTQDIEPVFVETSSFYIFRREIFTEHNRRIGFQPYIQEVDEKEAVDIDTREDYERACMFMSQEVRNG